MSFKFHKLFNEADVIAIVPDIYGDNRGVFLETYKKSDFEQIGIGVDFVQDNQSTSKKGTIRGLHYQTGEYAQGKLVRVLSGEIIDYAVNINKQSPFFGKYLCWKLDEVNKHMLYIPSYYAHGFIALQDNTVVSYKCTQEYNKNFEAGIRWNDPDINIKWPILNVNYLISDKDNNLPYLKDVII
jgi:dTDP-4-dehydrorhamnose 3,5-epimerase